VQILSGIYANKSFISSREIGNIREGIRKNRERRFM